VGFDSAIGLRFDALPINPRIVDIPLSGGDRKAQRSGSWKQLFTGAMQLRPALQPSAARIY